MYIYEQVFINVSFEKLLYLTGHLLLVNMFEK